MSAQIKLIMSQMELLRKKIDSLDRQIIRLLSERLTISRKIALYKRKKGLGIRQKEREENALQIRLDAGLKQHLPPSFVKAVFGVIFKHSRLKQQKLMGKRVL